MDSLIDRFLVKVFNVAKLISALVVFICILVAGYNGLALLFGGGQSIVTPKFSLVEQNLDKSNGRNNKESYAALEKKRAIQKEYGDSLQGLIKEYKLDSFIFDNIMNDLQSIDDKYRNDYYYGFEDFIEDAHYYIKKNKNKPGLKLGAFAMVYKELFLQNLQDAEASEIEYEGGRYETLAVFGAAILTLLAFLYIPLLIRIEQNTRIKAIEE